MIHRSQPNLVLLAVFFLWVLALAGCGERANFKAGYGGTPPVSAEAPVAAGVSPSSRAMAGAPAQATDVAPADGLATAGRHIAYTHRYTIEAERAALRAVVEAHAVRCKQLDCVLISRSVEEESDHAPPRAMLVVRVARKDTAAFAEALKAGDGRVVRQSTQAEDKTLQVADLEARIANLTQLRERLRKLMSDPRTGIKEAVEIERQLAQTQGELDSMQAQRRILAQETERELYEITYQARRSVITRSIFEPVKEALLSFGAVAMSSLAAMISLVAASLVWIAALAVLWAIYQRWRRSRKKIV